MMKYVECIREGKTLRGMMHIPEGASPGGAVAGLLAARRVEEICRVSLWSPAICCIDDSRKKNIQGVDLTD